MNALPNMADPIDALLQQLDQGNLDQGNTGRSSSKPQPLKMPETDPRSIEAPAVKSIDQLLAEIEGKPVSTKPSVVQPTLPIRSKVELQSVDPISYRPLTSENHQPAKQQEAIVRKAQAWLNALDPHDGNALFFERFAEKYPSRLEAAIDFLGLNPK